MNPRTFHTRRGCIHLALHVALLGICVRMAVIQGLHHRRYARMAIRMERDIVAREPRRGDIVDRNGRRLAVTTRAASVFANPRAVSARDRGRVSSRLAAVLALDPEQVAARLRREKYFVWIKRKVSSEEAEAVARLHLPGVAFREEFCRRYPNGTFLCHVLGFVGTDGDGLAGIEARFSRLLAGRPGEEAVLRDGLGRRLGARGSPASPVRHGPSLVLTIDARIQRIVEEELAGVYQEFRPESACAVVMDPWTGDVLALAAQPAFDPGDAWAVSPATWENMAVAQCVEPGSSFKPFVAAAALEHGVVTPETVFNCHRGRYRIGSRILHDAHPLGHLSVRDIVVFSSNIGMAQVCARLEPEALYQVLRGFGFGRKTGIELPGESAGILHPPRAWSKFSRSSLAMGQEIAVTPIQLTAAFCVFANGGWYVRPRIILAIADSDGRRALRRAGPPEFRRVLTERTALRMGRDLLVGVVERGTARRAALDGYCLAGKTGTAQIARTDGSGYEPGAYCAVFVGIAPADSPRFVIGLVAKRPRGRSYYGGVVAAPAVGRMAERMLSASRIPRAAASATGRSVAVR